MRKNCWLGVCSLDMTLSINQYISSIKIGLKCDIPLGLYIVRGDNVVLLGEVDDNKEKSLNLKEADEATVRQAETTKKGTEWDFEKIER
jgi:hypothetical protein